MSTDGFATTLVRIDEVKQSWFKTRTESTEPLAPLVESIKVNGVLEPIIIRITLGVPELIAGSRRLEAAKLAGLNVIPAVIKNDLTDEQAFQIQATENLHREDLSESEKTGLLDFYAEHFQKKPKEIADSLQMSYEWVVKYISDKYKDEKKAAAGSLGGLATAESAAQRTAEINPNLLVCEYCGVATSDCKPWNGHILCDKHWKRPEIDGYFRTKELETTIPIPKPLNKVADSWTNREARMHPQHSKLELEVLALLEKEESLRPIGLDRSFPLSDTIPDYTLTKLNLAVYLDGPVHEGKEDRDEKLRELLTKRYGVRVVSIKTEGLSAKAIVARIKEEA